MKVLGLDVGDKKIGVALSDELGLTAQGLTVIYRTSLKKDLEEIKKIIDLHHVTEVVIGYPRNMNGTAGPRAELVERFAWELYKFTGIKPVFWDERLSTVEAEKLLISGDISRRKRKKVIDKLAATLILSGYLNYKSKN
ncbi:Holliday junction resolvase RuvX [Carboxydothermus ferrireducens]|uniref:Putative pre-16S rRNA nuclease n=1 Tax=Carboxydothermus ferrireducens DSM 11255 TaxID=1119529 RepID=A0ABX2R9G2_9THEO|nr:Holliday junction resolvase RuvX [Carboxydothermus ferrireducens]NYE56423.1 putative Holliday junction resolvase [Carboxydothermus ferrireducens DSM 11255]